ncbi:Ribbon-helix-helix protein, copG family [Ruaniaceae bacterium KH17]|nr:Ribbon-helix-helix protein, copG family [Ruaniaceae bacterium KH17]
MLALLLPSFLGSRPQIDSRKAKWLMMTEYRNTIFGMSFKWDVDEDGVLIPPADGVWGTIDGVEITEELIDEIVKDAEDGFPGATFTKVGRPRSVGTDSAARVVTLRMSEEQYEAIQQRAAVERATASDVIRSALDTYLVS